MRAYVLKSRTNYATIFDMRTNRRQFLASTLATSLSGLTKASASSNWSSNTIKHLIPTANHEEFQIRVVFNEPQIAPVLKIASTWVSGNPADTQRTGWTFHPRDLTPDTQYELSLWGGNRAQPQRLSDPWPLKTYPHPEARPDHARILIYTCAGGHPLMSQGSQSIFQPMATRQALLERGLSFKPDALIAIGDQIYWDQRTILESTNPARRARSQTIYTRAGLLDRALAAAGTRNEDVLKIVAGEQITPLYGTMLRSTPSYFVNDDHDYFENDEATKRFVTLPPYDYQVRFADYVRNLYLPDFMRDPARSRPISGDRKDGMNASFGTLRWGRLLEILMYDCAGYLSLKGRTAGLVPANVEQWLKQRTANEEISQLLHVPSHPMGWSAGKWREWYPDVADTGVAGAQTAQIGVDGQAFKLTTDKPKFMWQEGWWQQHQRLVKTLSAQKHRAGVVLSGDLHATGHARIIKSGNLDLKANPVNTMITGPIGTGMGWPSRARGTAPQAANYLSLESPQHIREKNGFTIVDAYRDHLRVRLFAWRREESSVDEITSLMPYHDVQLPRR